MSGQLGSLDDLRALLGGNETPRHKPLPLPEAQIAELREVFSVYGKTSRFKPGDIVTFRKNAGRRVGPGQPMIVVEVRPDAFNEPLGGGNTDSNAYGNRNDVRIMLFAPGNNVICFWDESFSLEPWTA